MPRIAEIKEIDGAVWVRIDLATDPSGIGIYTPDEITKLRNDVISDCFRAVDELPPEDGPVDEWAAGRDNMKIDALDAILALKSPSGV